MPTLGDPPAAGHEYRDACKSCGSTEGRAWTYGANDGKSKGFSTCRSCGAVTKWIGSVKYVVGVKDKAQRIGLMKIIKRYLNMKNHIVNWRRYLRESRWNLDIV